MYILKLSFIRIQENDNIYNNILFVSYNFKLW